MAGMLRLASVVCLVVLASPALALEDPDTEVARRHFEKGRAFYDARDYHNALDEFLAARRAKAAPGLDFNIARCYDRLEDYDNAVRHYQLYLDARPSSPDSAEIKERVAVLKQRAGEAEEAKKTGVQPRLAPEAPVLLPSALDGVPLVDSRAVEEERARRRRRNGAIAGGVVAGVVVIAGAVVLGVLLSRPTAGYTQSDLGPFTVTR
jgi:hypothetical protein